MKHSHCRQRVIEMVVRWAEAGRIQSSSLSALVKQGRLLSHCLNGKLMELEIDEGPVAADASQHFLDRDAAGEFNLLVAQLRRRAEKAPPRHVDERLLDRDD